MESMGIIGFVFGLAALSLVLKSEKKIKELEQRLEQLEQPGPGPGAETDTQG